MAINNLFRYKVPFELGGHYTSWDEPTIPNKGYHYASGIIKNGESVGIRSSCDLFIDKLKPLFLYIISTMYHEAEMEVYFIEITVRVVKHGKCDYHDIVKYRFDTSPNNAITNYTRSWVYPFPEEFLNKKFHIVVESYVFMIDDNVRAMIADAEESMRRATVEEEERINITPTEETYREDCCVICLESTPNILFLDCRHIAICDVCASRKRKSVCDVCRAEIARKIKI